MNSVKILLMNCITMSNLYFICVLRYSSPEPVCQCRDNTHAMLPSSSHDQSMKLLCMVWHYNRGQDLDYTSCTSSATYLALWP